MASRRRSGSQRCLWALGVTIGLIVALLGISPRRWLRVLNRCYVEALRAVPLLVLLLWVYYGLPVVFGLEFGVCLPPA